MARMAPYDEIADWYEDEFLAKQRAHAAGNDFADEIGLDRSLHDLLGTGTGTCLEIGCGTGVYADRVRKLGWTPIGIDISSGMLRRALARLPVVQADVAQLPFADGSLAAVIAMMAHTDMPNYPSARCRRFEGCFDRAVYSSTLAFILVSVGVSQIAATSTPSWSGRGTSTVTGPPTRGRLRDCATRSALTIFRSRLS